MRDSFEGLGVGEIVKIDGSEDSNHCGLALRILEIGEVHFSQRVSLDHGGNGEDLVGLNGGDQDCDGLPDDDEDAFDGVGVLGCEGSRKTGIPSFGLIVFQE